MRLTDRDAAARGGVNPPRDFDHGEKYDGHDVLFPKGWDNLDPDRHDATGWGRCEGWAFVPHDTGQPSKFRWWHRCRSCGRLLEASSREALERKWREHGEGS